MNISEISGWLMTVLAGLWAGICLCYAVDRLSAWRRMPLDQFAIDFRRSQFRADPLQPALAIGSAVTGSVFAWEGAAYGRILAGIGVCLILLVIVASLAVGEPINRKFRRLPEGSVPEDANADRTKWTRFHRLRTIAALAAFGCLAGAGVTGRF